MIISVLNSCIQSVCISRETQAIIFSSPKAALLWPSPTPEVRDSQTFRHSAHAQSQVWQIWLDLVSSYCVYKAIQNRNLVGVGQRPRFLALTKRSAASADENEAKIVLCLLLGMACQVSGAVVAVVSAMTAELGRRLAPVIVEKGGKVGFIKEFLRVQCAMCCFSILICPVSSSSSPFLASAVVQFSY